MPTASLNGYGKVGRWLVASGLWARLSGAAKGVYNILAFHANDTGEAWPSIRTMCRENGTAKRATLRGLRELKAHRMIEPMGIQANSRGVVRYRLHFDPPAELWNAVGERPKSTPPLGAKTAPSERLDQGPKGRRVPGAKKAPSTRGQKGARELAIRGTSIKGTKKHASRATARPGSLSKSRPPVTLPEGFAEWLTAFNAALTLKYGYTPTSASGRRLATQYANILAEGRFSPANLLAAIPGAVRKATRLEIARRPAWLLANIEECLEEAASTKGQEGGRRVEPPGFCHSPTRWS